MTVNSPLEWLNTADPQILARFAASWVWTGDNLETVFTKYKNAVTTVNGTYWEGRSADAAQARAAADLKTMQALADKLDALATRARQGYEEINDPLQKARNLLTEAAGYGWQVGPALSIQAPEGTDQTKVDNLARDLRDYTWQAMTADGTVRDALNAARTDLAAAFTSAASLGAEQGNTDGAQLAKNPTALNDVALQRLIEAGQLTQEQIDALRAGDTAVIPASQMEYLIQLANSLDGKSPREIQQLMDQLPPGAAQALANSLQIVSNPKVSAGPVQDGDKDLPNGGLGGLNQLPDDMRDSLNRKSPLLMSGLLNQTLPTQDMDQTRALASIVGTSDIRYRAGSDLDKTLLQKAGAYLDASAAMAKQNPVAIETPLVSKTVQEIFTAVGDDKAAIRDVVTDGDNGQRFIGQVLSRNWNDDGAAAATLFTFDDRAATVENPNDKIDVKSAERAGNIMSAVAKYTADDEHWKQLSNLAGDKSESVGERNPLLIRQISTSMSPYIAEMAGGHRPDVQGFDVGMKDAHSWLDPGGNRSFQGARHVFSLMNTDDEAGKIFTDAAARAARANEIEFAQNLQVPHATTTLETSGRIDGLIDAALLEESKDRVDDANKAAQDAYDRKERWFNTGKSVAGIAVKQFPVAGDIVWDLADGQSDPIKESMLGPKPEPGETPQLTRPDDVFRTHNVLSQAQIPQIYQQQYSGLFENGSLKSWHDLTTGQLYEVERNRAGLTELLNKIDGEIDSGTQMIRAYDKAAAGLPARPDKLGEGGR
ncbi:hypothetical protein ACFXHA_15825 [Nocardia sp. NPDC059240]|uniref:TPR repeat region-containing protein n=1 Tax=Nocardia sp. NPDC059240 TaxID=3346786 RepID=UPI0036B45105